MSRPKPKILMSGIEGHMYNEIYESSKIWIIMYKDAACNWMRQPDYTNTLHASQSDVPTKYCRTLFHNKAHGVNKVKRLNKLFKCGDYWLKEIDFSKK